MIADDQLDFDTWVDQLMTRVVALALTFGGFFWIISGANIANFPSFALFSLSVIAFFFWFPLGTWLIDRFLTFVGETARPPRWWVGELAGLAFGLGMLVWGGAISYVLPLVKEALTK